MHVCVCVVCVLIAGLMPPYVLLSINYTLPPVTVNVSYILAAALALSTMHWLASASEGHHQIEGVSACKVT